MKVKIILQVAFAFGLFVLNRAEAITGTGTSANPYQIQNLTDFQSFCANSSYWGSGKYTKLMADIDLTGITYTQAPIAPDTSAADWFQGSPFSGHFDGNGCAIKNLKVTGDDSTWYMSLFGFLSSGGVIENLGVENCDLSGGKRVSGVCGWNEGIIRKCYAIGKAKGDTNIAGICGFCESGSLISQCYADVDLQATAEPSFAGGIVGINEGTIDDCFAHGDIHGKRIMGGVCGDNRHIISDSYATGRISTTYPSEVGGLSGRAGSSISNCFWDKLTTGRTWSAGGLGKTTTEMQQSSLFSTASWDFSATWKMSADYGGYNGYPIFKWMDDKVGFEYWAASLPEGQRNITDCPAGDKVPNLLKYASGLEPLIQCSNVDLYKISFGEPDYVTIRYYTSIEAHGVRTAPIFKEVLTQNSWKESSITPLWIEDQGTRSLWEIKLPISNCLFIRMQAEQTTD